MPEPTAAPAPNTRDKLAALLHAEWTRLAAATPHEAADVLLASDAIGDLVAEARAGALRDAADATLEAPWRLTGKAVATWLRRRAADEAPNDLTTP